MVGQDRDADADRDPLLDAGDRDRGDRGAEPLGELDRPGQAGVGEQDEERITAPTAARTSSPRACPDTSLTCLKWSRSRNRAASGAIVREAWAAIRRTVSCSARLFGGPVSELVEARISAMARLRRFASTGAAWMTDSLTRRWCSGSRGSARVIRTEPITSPPTRNGVQVELPGHSEHTGP